MAAQVADTPEGKPVAMPIPVALVVVWVIVFKVVLIHNVGAEEADPTVLAGLTLIKYVVVAICGAQAFELVTVIVRVMVVPASAVVGVYVGVRVVDPAVIDPAPFSDHKMVPFEAVTPLTVAVPLEQMVWLPPAEAVGCASTVKILVLVAVPRGVTTETNPVVAAVLSMAVI